MDEVRTYAEHLANNVSPRSLRVMKRLVYDGAFAYSSLTAGRPGTPSEGMIYLVANKDWMARFNLAWVLEQQE